MKTHLLFRQYTWLLDTIYRAGKISLDDINRRWLATEMSEGLTMPRSTFNHHRNAIEEMFGIYIECDRRDGYRYYIGNPEDLQSANIQHWLVNSLSASTLLAESRDLKDQILLEDIPSGQQFLETILVAIRHKQMLRINYQRFGMPDSVKDVEPYCVKLHHQRWYVLVHQPSSQYTGLTVYALDRILQLEILQDSHYSIPADFDAKLFFENYFGVYVDPSIPTQRVVLRAYGKQPDYFRTLPLHPTQKELATVTDVPEPYTDFEYRIALTYDFISELLSKNSWVEVMEPASLRERIVGEIEGMRRRYEEKL